MGMRIDHPSRKDAHIVIPDEFLGRHLKRHDEAVDKSLEARLPPLFASFAAGLAVLEDWTLPGLSANPEEWDFLEVPISVMAWVEEVALGRYNESFKVSPN